MYHLITCGDDDNCTYVDRPGYSNPYRCQLCQTLGIIDLTVTIEDSIKRRDLSIMMSSCVKLLTTIDRRPEARGGLSPSFLQIITTQCARWKCSVSEPVVAVTLSSSAARLTYNNHRNSCTLVYTLGLYSWRTNRSNNWSYSSCDRIQCHKDSNALSTSSSQAIIV